MKIICKNCEEEIDTVLLEQFAEDICHITGVTDAGEVLYVIAEEGKAEPGNLKCPSCMCDPSGK